MVQVHIALARVSGRAATGSTMPVVDAAPLAATTVTPGAISAAAALVAPDAACFWCVTASGGAVAAAFGPAPNAGADPGWLILDGQTREFAVGAAGETIALRAV